ncbi:hypothetical protein TELCIR_08711 [Teladorsagia circumcincta]|uniref:diacylglycerol O-acyltransferase n=1 Tax=Teladorsagia circumcincta TaxID=45464 RepID=A0A2G9UIB2_TELCI|nr:hypothetical protein TELCIR_08711 [Teladorsagia circumcincta]
MVQVLGIDFSPLTEPWDKKLQTLGVFIVYTMILPMIGMSLFLPLILNYLIACHPHGIICFGLYAAFIRETDVNKNRKFPNLHFLACTLKSNFYLMLRREWLLLSGFIDCSKESIRSALTARNAGQAVLLAVGKPCSRHL